MEITLSTTEAEYIVMGQALRNVISLINLLNELIPKFDIPYIQLIMKYTVFEDN